MKLLLYTNAYEPLTAVILKHSKQIDICSLSIQELLEKGQIFDEIKKNSTIIRWFTPCLGEINNSKDTLIINRIFAIPENLFENFKKVDQLYARNEFWAYLTFALNAFPKITENPGIGSLTGNCFSLMKQWELASEINPNIDTPVYFVGPFEMIPNELGSELIFSSPFNFYYWKTGVINEDSNKNVFVIKKPTGTPILVSVFNNEVVLNNMDNSSITLSSSFQKKLIKLGLSYHQFFGFYYSEILLFVDRNKITFGMINNCPLATSKTPCFEEMVLKEL